MSREIVEILEIIGRWGDTGRNMADRIERLLADERGRYLKRLREERGLFALSLQMLGERDFAVADKLATMRFATWEEVNSEAEKTSALLKELNP